MFVKLSERIVNTDHIAEIVTQCDFIEVRFDMVLPGFNSLDGLVDAEINSFTLKADSPDAQKLLECINAS